MADQEENTASSDAQAVNEAPSFSESDSNEPSSFDQIPTEQSFEPAPEQASEPVAAVEGDRQTGSKNARDYSDYNHQEEPGAKKPRREEESYSAEIPSFYSAADATAMSREQYAAAQSASNLFVNGLPGDYTEDKLRSLFAPYGEIETVKVMWDHMTGRTKGYGFVKFKDPNEAAKAIDALNGTRLADRDLLVKIADSGRTVPRPNMSGTPSPNVYVNGLPESVDDAQLRQLFAPFGPILDTKILVDLASGTSRGQAFVRYEQQSSAEYAISALNNYMFPGAVRGIMVRFADTQEEKAQQTPAAAHL
eukprot:TRINITY_DN145_c0_g2_i1.p1 TRINITY_DN145_c0_g2~~TRINITY_DN145_c0_g2_i1.p1  ORF type:complete len:330 (+),score=36.38 TRINITY_DN145_c0_g2_i1:70-990(+)